MNRINFKSPSAQFKLRVQYLLLQYGISKKFYIHFKDVDIHKKIGQGGFGNVYKGKYLGQDVAVKEFGRNRNKKIEKKVTYFLKEVEVIS